MSHFFVMVIGNDPESQLWPHSEHVDEPRHELERYKKRYAEDLHNKYFKGKTFAEYLTSNFGFIQVNKGDKKPGREKNYFIVENGEVIDVICYFNPDGKWDWHVLGGRWGSTLLLKERYEDGRKQYADQALKKEIDFDGMIAEAIEENGQKYDDIRKLIDPFINDLYIPFVEIKEIEPDIEKARAKYNKQPIVQAFSKSNLFFESVDDFLIPKEEFIEKNKYNNICPFAFVKDGEWHEKGKMAWWAIVKDEDENWKAKFFELLKSLDDDELISIYDCHI